MHAITRIGRRPWAFPVAFAVTLVILAAVAAASGPAHGADATVLAVADRAAPAEGPAEGYGLLGFLFIIAALAMLTFGWRVPGAGRRRD